MPTSSEVAAAQNPYPDDVDMQTTASIGRRAFAPAVGVGERVALPDNGAPGRKSYTAMNAGYQQAAYTPRQLPSGGQPETLQSYGQKARNTYNQANNTYNQATGYVNNAKSTYNTYSSAARQIPGTDDIVTGSVKRAAYAQARAQAANLTKLNYTEEKEAPVPASKVIDKATSEKQARTVATSGGWSAVGGTRIKIAQGETLYNLSKRFGVPVDALLEVNGIGDPALVKAGQDILIPTYVYNKSNPTSAPDSDPKTRAARASTGNIGEVSAAQAPVPDRRPSDYVFAKANSAGKDMRPWTVEVAQNKKQPANAANDAGIDNTATGSTRKSTNKDRVAGGKYQVEPGDSVYGISRKTGVSIAALVAANNIQNNIIKIGQWLVIPDGSEAAAATAQNANVNTNASAEKQKSSVKMASVETAGSHRARDFKEPKPYVKPAVKKKVDDTTTASIDPSAPERSGFGNWRRPVHGRIISAFGEKRGYSRNDGIDISVPEGTPVKAVENGVVIYSSNELLQFGNLVLIRHQDGFVSAYANLKNYGVQKGDTVRRGQIIGRSGRTGRVNQPQLHFELRKNSNPVDPNKYFASN